MIEVPHPLTTTLIYLTMGPPARVIEKVSVAGLVISTIETYDIGWETAIAVEGSDDDWHPVERYPDQETAEAGHARWVELAPGLTEVTDLGLPGYVEPRLVSLIRWMRSSAINAGRSLSL